MKFEIDKFPVEFVKNDSQPFHLNNQAKKNLFPQLAEYQMNWSYNAQLQQMEDFIKYFPTESKSSFIPKESWYDFTEKDTKSSYQQEYTKRSYQQEYTKRSYQQEYTKRIDPPAEPTFTPVTDASN
jgi:hypothetical protein